MLACRPHPDRKQDEQAIIQSLGSGKTLGTLKTDAHRFYLDQGGRWLVAARENEIYLWSIMDQTQVAMIELQNAPKAIGFSHDGQYLAAISEQAAEIWQLTNGVMQCDRIVFRNLIGDPQTGFMGYITFSEDDRFIMAMTDEGEVNRIWLWRSPDLIAEVCSYVPQLECNR